MELLTLCHPLWQGDTAETSNHRDRRTWSETFGAKLTFNNSFRFVTESMSNCRSYTHTDNTLAITSIPTRKPSYRWQTRATQSLPKLLQFDVPTTLSLTILAYLHAFNCYCVRNPRNPEKFTENSNLWSSRSSKVIDIGVNRNPYVTCY